MPSMPAIALKATLATTLSEMVTPLAAAGASGLGVSVIAVLPSSVVDGRRVRRPGTSVRLLYPSRGAACQTPRRKRREECVLADGAAGSAAVAVGASGIVAHRAAALVPHVAAAVGASALRHLGEGELRLRSAGRCRSGAGHVAPLERLADGVGAAQRGVGAHAVGHVAADAFELFHDLAGRGALLESEGDKPAQCFGVARSATAGLAHVGEDLAGSVLVVVHDDEQLAAARVHALRLAAEQLRPRGPRGGDASRGRVTLFLALTDVEHLLLAAAVAVDGDALAAAAEGQQVDVLDVVAGGLVGEVDRLGDGVVGALLEGRLQLDVPLRGDVVGGGEDLLHVRGHAVEVPHGAHLGDLLHELVAEEAALPRDLLEVGVTLDHAVVVEHVGAHVADREQGLDAARAAGDDADGARGRDRGDGGVAHAGARGAVEDGALEVGEHAALAGQLLAGRAGLVVDEAHDIAGDLAGVFGVVRHLEAQQHVGEAHDAETDLAVALGHPLDLGQRVAIDVDDVVEKAHGGAHDAAQGAVVDVAVGHDPAEIDGAQVAALVGQQRLLAAGVGALDLAELRRGVVGVDAVDEDDAGVAVLPGERDHGLEHGAGAQGAYHVAGARVDQRVLLVGVDGAHEGVGDGHRDVEVVEAVVVLLGPDEVEDVRVIDAHDAHVGAAPRAALLDGLGGGIEDVHELSLIHI